MGSKLSTVRLSIDRLDERLLRLLNQRANLALAIGRIKKRRKWPVYDARREAAVLGHVIHANRGPLSSIPRNKGSAPVMQDLMGGHIDSWDVGTGAMDDGGGVVAAWEAIRLLNRLGLRARRTIRVVGWTNEENGLRGGTGYRDAHLAELDNHVLAIESDGGVFRPLGFAFTGSDSALAVARQIGSLLRAIGTDSVARGGGGADIGPIMARGVPGMGLAVDGTRYFWYHHTDADTVDKLDPRDMARCVAAMAVMAYVVADLPERLPRVPAPAGR